MGRIHADGPDIWAQVPYAVSNEWAATVDDVLLRRTTVGLRGQADQSIRERVAAAITSPGPARLPGRRHGCEPMVRVR